MMVESEPSTPFNDTKFPPRPQRNDSTNSDLAASKEMPHVAFSDGQDRFHDRIADEFPGWGVHYLRWPCIILHVSLVLLHIVFLIAWARRAEHHLVIPLSQSGTAATITVVLTQAFVSVYTVLLVVSTQQLSLRGTLLKHQTLTATHDESTAWTGLGSALLSVWRQTYLAASVIGTISIAFYLGMIAILHISTPSIFNMQAFNSTNGAIVATTVGMPNITVHEIPNSPGTQAISPFKFWQDSTTLLPYLGRANDKNTIGVHNATLYDVVANNDGIGNVSVGATAFSVACGTLPNTTVTGVADSTSNKTSSWIATSSYEGYNISFYVETISPYVLRQVDYSRLDMAGSRLLARNMIFYMSTNISDSSGDIAPDTALKPTMPLVPRLLIIGCTLSTVPQHATIDAQTKQLISVEPDAKKSSSAWQTWLPEQQNTNYYWPWVKDPQLDAWGDMFDSVPAGTVAVTDDCVQPPCDRLTYSEEYLMGRLGLYPAYENTDMAPIPPPKLYQLENALASMTASLYWAAGNVQPDPFGRSDTTLSPASQFVRLSGQALLTIVEARLNLNIIPIVVGLGISILLLILALVLIRLPPGHHAVVNGVGVLELTWLMHERSALRERLAQVEEPTVQNLRQAGMFEVRFASKAQPRDSSQYGFLHLRNTENHSPH